MLVKSGASEHPSIAGTTSTFCEGTSRDESVDLVYLDPPFKSNQDYNVLFAEQDCSRSAAQIKAFGDTWPWDQQPEPTNGNNVHY
jgi:16S rRNA G966 N2-methylase RsmD